MNQKLSRVMAVAAFAVAAGAAMAEPPADRNMGDRNRPRDYWRHPAKRWQKTSDIIGKKVLSSTSQDCGDVQDMIVDMNSARILYYIIGVDGQQVAVPTFSLMLPDDAKNFKIDCTKEDLKSRAYDKNSIPDYGDPAWGERVHVQFHQTPYWQDPYVEVKTRDGKTEVNVAKNQGTMHHMWYERAEKWQKASDILNKRVVNRQNENLGKIEDLTVDPDAGRIIYAVLSFGGFLGVGDKLFALPWTSMELTGDNKSFIVEIDKERFKNVAGFDKKNWPNMADERWATEIHKSYNQRPYWQRYERSGETAAERRDRMGTDKTDTTNHPENNP